MSEKVGSATEPNDWRGLILPTGTMMSAKLALLPTGKNADGISTFDLRSTEPGPEEEGEEPAGLRGWLLLWDKLVIPQGDGLFQTFPTRSFQFLEAAGVIDTCRLEPDEEMQAWDQMEAAYPELEASDLVRPAISLLAFQKMESIQPGRWSIATERGGFNELMFTEPGRAILFNLHQALPIPRADTPLEDLLEFRLRRSTERIALRTHLERLYQSVMRAGDGPLALRTEFEALAATIRDLTAVTEESGLRFNFAGIEARLKWEFDPLAALSGAGTAALLGSLPAAVASMAAGILPKVEVSAGAGLRNFRNSTTPYEYAVMMQREL